MQRAALRLLVLCLLFSAAAVYEAVKVSAVTRPEVWVHLRTGAWILQNHAVPRSGLFSQYPDLRWNDSTWGFDALLGAAYRLLGLRAIPVLLIALKILLAMVTFWLARAARAGFWNAALLSGMAQFVITDVQPLPYVLSILFFAVELRWLVASRVTGTATQLFWLPLLFLVWVNLHVQFVAGLLLLILFVAAIAVEQGLRSVAPGWVSQRILPVDLRHAGIVTSASIVCSLINPYGFRLVPTAIKALYSAVGFEHFTEMSSMNFRRPQDFVLMLVVMMAFLTLGRRRSLDLLALFTLVGGTLLAFRIERDGWLAVLSALAVLSGGFGSRPDEIVEKEGADTYPRFAWAALGAAVIAVIAILLFVPRGEVLIRRANESFPVKACDYIRSNHLPQPVFNEYSWGSFMTWYLPEYPVAVDSRLELYGDEILGKYFDIVGGKELLESEPMVSRAGTLVLERESAMAKALRNFPALSSQYRQVYSDEIASVFVARTAKPQ